MLAVEMQAGERHQLCRLDRPLQRRAHAHRAQQRALDAAVAQGNQEAQIMAKVTGMMQGSVAISLAKLIFYLPYPIVLLIYFTRARVKEALAPPE